MSTLQNPRAEDDFMATFRWPDGRVLDLTATELRMVLNFVGYESPDPPAYGRFLGLLRFLAALHRPARTLDDAPRR